MNHNKSTHSLLITKTAIVGIFISCLIGFGMISQPSFAEMPSPIIPTIKVPPTPTPKQKPDINMPPTVKDQLSQQTDESLVQRIQQSLNKEVALSPLAKNVKISANNGIVTLQGTVQSNDEKTTVEAKAQGIAGGTSKVRSQLKVASNY